MSKSTLRFESHCALTTRVRTVLVNSRIVGKQEVIRFLPVCPSSSRNRRQVPAELPIFSILTSSLRWPMATIRTGTEKASSPSHSRAASSANLNIY